MSGTYTIVLPWKRPLLSMNDRKHWRERARITKQIRETTKLLAWGIPAGHDRIEIGLHYRPRDRRRRDSDNLVPILKACADGLVDAGIVRDDTPDLMTKLMPVIHPAVSGDLGAMWLEIRGING